MKRAKLVNYWPIENKTAKDLVRSKDMKNVYNIEYTSNRLGIKDSALSLKNGNTAVSEGSYFEKKFTILLWVKLKSHFSWHRLLDFGNEQSTNNIRIDLSDNRRKINFRIINLDKNIDLNIVSNKILFVNEWYHLGFIFNENKLSIYINGTEDNNRFLNQNTILNSKSRTHCYFGKRNKYSNTFLGNFLIDEIKFFDNELDDLEIKNEFKFGYH